MITIGQVAAAAMLTALGRYDEAENVAREVAAHAWQSGDTRTVAWALVSLADALAHRGETQAAKEVLAAAAPVVASPGDALTRYGRTQSVDLAARLRPADPSPPLEDVLVRIGILTYSLPTHAHL